MSRQLEKLEELSRLIEAAKTMPLKEDPAYKEPEFDKLYRLSFRVGNYGIVELNTQKGLRGDMTPDKKTLEEIIDYVYAQYIKAMDASKKALQAARYEKKNPDYQFHRGCEIQAKMILEWIEGPEEQI